jgi:hypothetical protein
MKCTGCGTEVLVKVLDWVINGQQVAAPSSPVCYACLWAATKEAILPLELKSLRALTVELTTEKVDTVGSVEVSSEVTEDPTTEAPQA